MKITPDLQAAIENMIARAEKESKDYSPDCTNQAAFLAGNLMGAFRCINFYDTTEQWLAAITK